MAGVDYDAFDALDALVNRMQEIQKIFEGIEEFIEEEIRKENEDKARRYDEGDERVYDPYASDDEDSYKSLTVCFDLNIETDEGKLTIFFVIEHAKLLFDDEHLQQREQSIDVELKDVEKFLEIFGSFLDEFKYDGKYNKITTNEIRRLINKDDENTDEENADEEKDCEEDE